MSGRRFKSFTILFASMLGALLLRTAQAQTEPERRLADASEVLRQFTEDDDDAIPEQLLARARGIAVIPDVIRGGFIIGGRRGRGVLAVRSPDGEWSNPALITLTSGSIGWQFGAESADLVLVFANERSVRNIADGRFTLGGNASAVAGPVGKHTSAAITFNAEVYVYVHSEGLFAGAAFEGVRLDVDEQGSERYYAADPRARALGEQNAGTPESARRFLSNLDRATSAAPDVSSAAAPPQEPEQAVTFPLGQ